MTPKLLIIISIVIFLIISISSMLQGYYTCSDLLFMCFIYSGVLVTFYFLYGIKMERNVVEKQIQKFTDETFDILKNKFNIQPKDKIILEDLNKEYTDKELGVITANKKIKHDISRVIVLFILIATVLSVSIWIIFNQKHAYYNLHGYGKNIIIKNLILILFVLMVQFTFSTLVVGKIMPFRTEEIIKVIMESII